MQGHLRVVWKVRDRDSGLGRDLRWRCRRGHRRAKQWPPARVGAGSRHKGTRVQARRRKGRSKNGKWLALNRATSLRSGQRRDVWGNVVTF